MDVDWEVEVGGDAPVIDADWSGFVDLRVDPERVTEIAEAAAFPPLARFLLLLNGPQSDVWTSKCDVWEPEPGALACYFDLLPREGKVFRFLPQAELFCRQQVCALDAWKPLTDGVVGDSEQTKEPGPDVSLTLVIREAIASGVEGYGVTAYLCTRQAPSSGARRILSLAMAAVAGTLSPDGVPAKTRSKLK